MIGSAYTDSSAQTGSVTPMTRPTTREKPSEMPSSCCSLIRENAASVTRRIAEPMTVEGHDATLNASRYSPSSTGPNRCPTTT